MGQTSPLAQAKELATTISVLLRQFSDDQDRDAQKLMADLKHLVADMRLDVRDAEFADTGHEYHRHVGEARERIASIITAILALSQYNIFSSIEVAELSARLEQLGSEL